MRRILLAAGLLAAMAILAWCSFAYLERDGGALTALLEETERLAAREQWQEALDASEKLAARWDRSNARYGVLMGHTELLAIDAAVYRLVAAAERQNGDALADCAAEFRCLLRHITVSEGLSWRSVL